MNVEILETREQPLLGRKVVKASLRFEGATPSRKEVLSTLANQLKAKEEQVVLKTVRSAFGRTKAIATLHLYKSRKQAERFEPRYRFDRGKPKVKKEKPAEAPKEEAKPEEKPAEEKPAEAPKEEKPAESPAEAKPEEKPKEEKPAEKKEGA